MMTHHSPRDYNEAASEAAVGARAKFEALIEKGRQSLDTTIERINNEVPEDRIVPYRKMSFGIDAGRIILEHPDADGSLHSAPLHKHALDQAGQKSGIPKTYIDRLMAKGPRHQELLAYNFNELFADEGGKGLVRYVDGETRGLLSDKYKRMNSRQLIDALLKGAGNYGAIPIEGVHLGTRTAMKVVLPYVFEPVPNEVMIYGLAWGNSEFGDGAYWMRSFVNRLWCTNTATLEEELRKVHLGKRLGEDVAWSEQTYQLDQATLVSMTSDIVEKVFHPDRVKLTMNTIVEANEAKVNPQQIGAFMKKHLSKDEVELAKEVFTSADVENVPAGQTRWRLSNAISYLAGTLDDARRRLELQEVAGLALKAEAA